MKVVKAESPDQLREARCLFEEYGATLPPELWVEDYRKEVDGLPGEYGAPFGCLLLAVTDDGQSAGCTALRRWQPGTAEMKRMYVRPAHRGRGVGKCLAVAAIQEAVNAGYHRIVLDTAPTMTDAIRLYEGLGFRRIGPYRQYPFDDVIFMEVKLTQLPEASP